MSNPTRPYQPEFYNRSERVRDPDSRQRKAAKISHIFETYSHSDLTSSICLDVGCSSGIITREISHIFGKTIGLEYDGVSLSNIDPSSKQSLTFIQGDAMMLPFADSSVDVIICAQVYEHVPDDVILFKEIYRVLKPGGLLFFSGPNKLYPIEPHYFLPLLHWLPQRLADRYLQLLRRGDHYYERSRTIWSLRKLLAGYEIRDLTFPILIHEMAGKKKARGFVQVLRRIPEFLWAPFLPFIPNYNWLLRKPAKP